MLVNPFKKTNRKPKVEFAKPIVKEKPLGPISLATKIVESKDWTYGIRFNTSTTLIKG